MREAYMNGEKINVPDIGDKLFRTVCTKGHEFEKTPIKGTVVYVHPELRYYVLQFGAPPYTYRESYIIGR